MTDPVNRNILLRQINFVRAAANMALLKKIPKGVKSAIYECPIANALSNGIKAEVDGTEIVLEFPRNTSKDKLEAVAKKLRQLFEKVEVLHDELKWDKPKISFIPSKTMSNFISRFDNGEFKDLIQGK